MKKGGIKQGPRLSTRILLAALAAALAVTGWCAWQIFGKKLQTPAPAAAQALSAELSEEEQALLQEQLQWEEKLAASGIVDFSPSSEELQAGNVVAVANERTALEALQALQYQMHIGSVSEEYRCESRQTLGVRNYYTLQQYWQGIPVLGYALIMDVDGNGQLARISGTYYDMKDFDPAVILSEAEARELVISYLSSSDGLREEDYNLQSSGQVIAVRNDAPVSAYRFYLTESLTNGAYRSLLVDGNSGTILMDNYLIETETVTGTLTGQLETHDNVNYWKEAEGLYKLYDEQRNIQIYNATEFVSPNNLPDDSTSYTEHIAENPDSFDKSAVDALANLQIAYNYYWDNFSRQGITGNTNHKLTVITNLKYLIQESGTGVYGLINNAGMQGTDLMVVGVSAYGLDLSTQIDVTAEISTPTKSAYLENMAHEYTHGVVNSLTNHAFPGEPEEAQSSVQMAVNEGIADIMAEYVEDYADDGILNNSCDWIHGNRIMTDPTGKYLNDALEFIEGTTDCHDGATVLGHAAYLISKGIDGNMSTLNDKAVSNAVMQKVWYSAIPQFIGTTDFQSVRKIIENMAVDACYGGGYANGDLSFSLTEDQLECILDAFDRVHIRPQYDLILTDNAALTVYDKDYEVYDNYHITIKQKNTENIVRSDDVHTAAYQLDLKPGIYDVVLTDLANEDLAETRTLIVNDADSQSKVTYSPRGAVKTNFGAEPRDVVLVLDVSDSMSGTPITETRQAAVSFVETVLKQSGGTRISLVTYNENAAAPVTAENDISTLRQAIGSLGTSGSTNLYDGLSQAQEILAGQDADTKLIVVMSDGLPNRGPSTGSSYTAPVIALADEIKAEDTLIYSMGFFHNSSGSDLQDGQSLMAAIASPGYHYEVSDADALAYVLDDVAQQISGSQYTYIHIACPVNVRVEKDGEVLSSDEESLSTRASYGTLTLVGEGSEQEKMLRLDAGQEYEIAVEGYDEGVMNITVSYPDENGEYSDTRTYENISVQNGSFFTMNTRQTRQVSLQQDEDGDGTFETVYSAEKNKTAADSRAQTRRVALIVCVLLLILWVVLHIRGAVQRFRHNRVCSACGEPTERKQVFCRKCGAPIRRLPLVDFGVIGYTKEGRAFRVIKAVFTAAFILIAAAGVLFYRSPAFSTYQLLMSQQTQAAQRTYSLAVEDSLIGKKLFEPLSGLYLQQVEQAQANGSLSEEEAQQARELLSGLKNT